MKRAFLTLALLVLGTVALFPAPAANSGEQAAVRAAIENYMQGHATGAGEHFRKVFHPDSKLFWVRDGQLMQRTSADYIAGAQGRPAADEAQRKRWIETIDITNNAAVVKVVLDYPNTKLTDYMSMLKINGEWKIVNKTFTSEPKSR